MNKRFLRVVTDHLILGLSILLIFFVVFKPYLDIPYPVLYAGRLHPVILHFPIVLVIITVLNSFTKNKYYQEILLPVTAVFTLVTAISGFLLSQGNESRGEILVSHQWMGTGVALLTALWYAGENKIKIPLALSGILRISMILLIISAGHFGGMITHGRNFLSWNSGKSVKNSQIPEDPLVFEHIVFPVLEQKCTGCHNPDKSKGGLMMENFASLMQGGESGTAVVPGDPGGSELIRRIRLSLMNEDHMPPEDQEQLSNAEIELLEGWIAAGSSDTQRLSQVDASDPFFTVLAEFAKPDDQVRWDHLPAVDESMIERLSSDYYTVRRMAEQSNALSVMIQPHAEYPRHRLSRLQPVQENIVELDLSFLPLEDTEMDFISGCHALEWLEIDFTPVDDDKFSLLENLDNLRVLKAQGSLITEKSRDQLMGFKNLQKLYIWDTGIPDELLAGMTSRNDHMEINTGIDKNISFTSVLPVPEINPAVHFFIEPYSIRFEHPLRDINIYYSFDEDKPQTKGSLYKTPVLIDKTCKIRYMASKEGWVASPVDSMMIFKTCERPDSILLLESPDPKYPGKGATSLFDLKKGQSTPQDSAWLGFQENKMVLACHWSEPQEFSAIRLSTLVNTAVHIFPPSRIEVMGGEGEQRQLGIYNFPTLKNNEQSGFRFIEVPIDRKPVTHLLITITPLARLPQWHNDRGKPGWFFVDEMILEENPDLP